MPTPFSHLAISYRLLEDDLLPRGTRDLLMAHLPAFLLGSVAADASVPGGREVTHFYRYDRPMTDHPWRVMLAEHSHLQSVTELVHRVFLAGYVAHLATDEYWSRYMLRPHFAKGEWGESLEARFFALHFLLIAMDERDERLLPAWIPMRLREALPQGWLPFISDVTLCEWRDFIAEQMVGESQTVAIFAERIRYSAVAMRDLLDDASRMQRLLWDHITPTLLSDLETRLYDFTREQLQRYLADLP